MATQGANLDRENAGQQDYERRFVRAFTGVLWLTTIALCAYVGVTIIAPVNGEGLPEGGLGTLVVLVVTIFGILITGLFVFMAFRIDRGARLEASEVAGVAATEVAAKEAQTTAEATMASIADDARKIAREQAKVTAARSASQRASLVAQRALDEQLDEHFDELVLRVAEAVLEARRKGQTGRGDNVN